MAVDHKAASDDGPGTPKQPFKTISQAAKILLSGEKVIVHAGIYREHIAPARGGAGESDMICYQAAPGEKVILRGSRVWKGPFVPSSGWEVGAKSGAKIWMGNLPAEWFATGYNPFLVRNICDHFYTFTRNFNTQEGEQFLKRRGMIFVDGQPLKQVFWPHQIGETEGADGVFWVEEPGMRVHFRLKKDADPRRASMEVTTQEQIFAPVERYLDYIRVTGFHVEHAADGVPVPQRAAVSTTRGHHWIIEDCTIRHANAVGAQDWRAADPHKSGHQIVRRNHISECGVCGIAGAHGVDGSLVEDNIVEHIGGLGLERIWECAGLKFHLCTGVLIRRNVFRHIPAAAGVWLDYHIVNTRVTGNVFADIAGHCGGMYLEVSHAPNMIDGNIFWNIRGRMNWQTPSVRTQPSAINVCTGEESLVANNFIANVPDGFGLFVSMAQKERLVDGRTGLCRRHRVFNNVLVGCAKRVLLGHVQDNRVDGNLYDAANDAASFEIAHPDPAAKQNFAAWQEYFGMDRGGAQLPLKADFDPETLQLTLMCQGPIPETSAGEPWLKECYPMAGPFTARQWQILIAGKPLKVL